MNKRIYQKLMVALAAPLLCMGCSRGELPEEEGAFPSGDEQGLVEIRLQSAASSLEGVTRTPFIGAIGTANPLAARVLMTAVSGKYLDGSTSGYYKGSMTFDGKTAAKGFSTRQYYPADGSNIYLCGLYPDDDRWTNYAGTSTTVDFTFDGKTDVMAAAQVQTNKAEAQAGTYKELIFKHLLTNLIVKAEVDLTESGTTATDIRNSWGEITSIDLKYVNGTTPPRNKVTVTLSDASAATASAFAVNGTYGVGFYKMTGKNFPKTGVTTDLFAFTDNAFASTAIPETASAVAYSIVAPIAATGTKDFTLLVKTAKSKSGGVEVPVNLTAGDTQGKYCVVTLKFKNTTIQAKASVQDWKEGSTADSVIQ